jgi:uncharacterized protein (TIGR00725 family)
MDLTFLEKAATICALEETWSMGKIDGKKLHRNPACEAEQIRVGREACQDLKIRVQSTEAPIVLVVGSATSNKYSEFAKDLGQALSKLGWILVTGGRGGIMKDATDGYLSTGLKLAALGIIPSRKQPQVQAPAIVIRTQLPGDDPVSLCSRNHINVILADRVVCMPGSEGTIAEAKLASQLYSKPVRFWPTIGKGTDNMEKWWQYAGSGRFLDGLDDMFLDHSRPVE